MAEAFATVSPDVIEVERGTYFVLAQRNALTLSMTLGNEFNVTMPDPVDLSVFCLGGLGIQRPAGVARRRRLAPRPLG